jgi:glycosyltransferase involved in cell wall biosynthesis
MRISVDARPFENSLTGAGRVLEGLLAAWRRSFPGDSFVLLSPRPVVLPPALGGDAAIEVQRSVPLPGTLWLQTLAPGAARRAGADLFLGSLAIVPALSTLPSVALVHDLTPLLFPEWHSRKNRLGFTPFIGATVRRARRIAAVSEATRQDLVAAFPDAAGKTRVVHNGIEPEAPGAEGEPPHEGRPYVLYVGTLEPRKNVVRLVAAMETIWDRRAGFPDLVLAGGYGWGMGGFEEDVARSRHSNRIALAGYLGAGERARWLRDARVFAYPSLYEGFGLPPLEAMAQGTPVVGSAASSLPEVMGSAGLLPDPTSVPDIAQALERAHDDGAFRRRAAVEGPRRAAIFTWAAAAAKMRALFEEALA